MSGRIAGTGEGGQGMAGPGAAPAAWGHLAFPPPEVGLEWEAWHRGRVWLEFFLCLSWRREGLRALGELCTQRGLK